MKNDNIIRKLLNDGTYNVNEAGQVFDKNGKELVFSPNNYGYRKLRVLIDGVLKGLCVHRMVYIKFKDSDSVDSHQIDHKDDDKTNNALSNLELVTNGENVRRSLAKKARRALQPNEVADVLVRHFANKESRAEIVLQTGIHSKSVDHILSGKGWRHFDYLRDELFKTSSLTLPSSRAI
jgi:hypothetical protein